MITTALSVGSGGTINLGAGPTFGILLAILFTHGIVCSAATAVIARLNIFYVLVNGMSAGVRCEHVPLFQGIETTRGLTNLIYKVK